MAKSEENDNEKKRKKKEKKEKRKKNKEKGKELNLEGSEEEKNAWKEGKIDKNRKGRKSVTFADSYPFDPAYRDVCVADALRVMFEGLEEHIADKPFYPKYVAHAVSRTVAQMIQMVCYSHIYWMDNWLVQQEGGAIEEWDIPEELELPPIDTWARAVIPMKQSSMPVTFIRPSRSATGQFKQFQKLEVDHQALEVPRNPVWRRASDTNILAHKKMRKCDHCTTFDMGEVRRRKSNNPQEIAWQKKNILGKVRRRLSSMFRDQAMLNKVLKAKGLLPPPKPTKFEENPRPPPPYFEAY